MQNLDVEQKMYNIAKKLIEKRYPVGWGGVAVIHTEKDNYFSSVPIETANGSASLCIEVGVTTDDGTILFVKLKELQPYHWSKAYKPEEMERYEEEIAYPV